MERLSLCERLAHVGSEVHRALSRREKGDEARCRSAFHRALDLLDICLAAEKNGSRLREIARLREALVDYFAAGNEFRSSADLWRRYFDRFNHAARRNR